MSEPDSEPRSPEPAPEGGGEGVPESQPPEASEAGHPPHEAEGAETGDAGRDPGEAVGSATPDLAPSAAEESSAASETTEGVDAADPAERVDPARAAESSPPSSEQTAETAAEPSSGGAAGAAPDAPSPTLPETSPEDTTSSVLAPELLLTGGGSAHEALHVQPAPEPVAPASAPAPGPAAPPPAAAGAEPGKSAAPLSLPPLHYGRLVAFAAILVSTGIFLTYGLSPDQGPTLRTLALGPGAWSEVSTQGWRLVSGTLTHTSLWIGIVSVFLLWIALGEFESRAGASGTLLLLIPGGAALNALRVQVEPGNTLFHGSGGWCVSLAAIVAASVLARRRSEDPKRPLIALAIQGGLFAAFMFFTGNWDNALLTSAGAAILLGGALGLAWPSGVRQVENLGSAPRSEAPLRWGVGLVSLLVLGGALLQAQARRASGPPGLEPLPAISEPFVAEPLQVEFKLPAGWSEMPLPKEVECGTCGTKAKWERAHVNDPIPDPKQCANCSDEVLHGNRYVAFYMGGGGLLGGPQRGLFLQAQDDLQLYDADTLIEEVIQREFRRDDSEFREAPIEREEFFQTETFERGFRLVLRGKKERLTFYAFKTKKRLNLLMFRGPAPTSPLSVEWEDRFHESIVETLRPWKPSKEAPQPTPAASGKQKSGG